MVDLTSSGEIAHALVLAAASMKASDTASPTMWYLTRMMAVAAYVSLTLSVVFGMLRGIARKAGEHLTWVVDELHQFLATMTGVLVVGHLTTLVLDPFLPFSVLNVLEPLNEPYRPFAVGLGVAALYAMAALLLSSWLRRHLSYRFWRGLHYVSFAAFILVTAHGLLAGSDAREVWMSALYAGAAGGIGFLVLMRLLGKSAGARKSA